MFRPKHVAITGFEVVDADDTVEKRIRGSLIPAMATIMEESHMGWEDWNIKNIGDPANMMYWRLDPQSPPSRGAVSGSYSYAFPTRKVPTGEHLPLELPGFLALDYEPLRIEEASRLDWIVLGTVAHGDRRKLAFRSGGNPLLIADHRSAVAPDLSTDVHDGRGLSHDPDRKAGLHSAWEVREWIPPGTTAALPKTGSSFPPPGPKRYSIAWVADNAPDDTGFARVGFGDRDGLYGAGAAGPFKPSFRQKHLHETTGDGDILAGGFTTNTYFVGSGMPFTAPLQFEEEPYPTVKDSGFPHWVHLYYDANTKHPFMSEDRMGMWRWFVRIPVSETPKCTPTKDYSTTDANDNPRRTFAEDSRLFIPKKVISNGVLFQPRVNLMLGRKPDRSAASPQAKL